MNRFRQAFRRRHDRAPTYTHGLSVLLLVLPRVRRRLDRTSEDLDPVTSVRSLHYLRTVYLRLRWLADAGCIFLGHGLNKDFRMFNLTLPPEQVGFDRTLKSSASPKPFPLPLFKSTESTEPPESC